MKPTGTNTALSTRPMAMTGPETSSIALIVASFGCMPCSMWCITASTTTIASSTTMPMASTRPRSESTLIEKPSSGKKMNAPIERDGHRHQRNQRRAPVLEEDEDDDDHERDGFEQRVEDLVDAFRRPAASYQARPGTPCRGGSAFFRFVHFGFLTFLATSRALVPGIWNTAITAAGLAVVPADRRCRASSRARAGRRPSAAPATRSGLVRTTMLPNSSSFEQAALRT